MSISCASHPLEHKPVAERRRRPADRPPAVILAGGYGARLRGLTQQLPKAMAPVAGRPVLERILEHVQRHGVREAALALYYRADAIAQCFPPGRWGGLRLHSCIAPQDYGTAGSARNACSFVAGEDLLLYWGDILTDFDLTRLVEFHCARKSRFTIGLARVEDGSPYGVVECDASDRIVRYAEKPRRTAPSGCWVNSGLCVIRRSLLERVPRGAFVDFDLHFIPQLLAAEEPILGCRLDGFWFDIGAPERLREAETFLLSRNLAMTA
ncbi:MAG: NDP-sugar synthase [Candidatus Sumerlaeota bacterium]|nr:NDP-sugar synthase [Candidatus Sumerlaeota bacterium]